MRIALALAALLLLGVPSTGFAGPPAQTIVPTTQPPGGLVIQADVVSGVPGPTSCVLQSRFSAGEKVVFRATAIDPLTGQVARDATLTVRFADGTTLPMAYGPHPGRGTPTDEFWTAGWVVPDDMSVGVVRYTIEAVLEARSGRFEPFNVESSLLTVVPRS
jgi:hypothetical protein